MPPVELDEAVGPTGTKGTSEGRPHLRLPSLSSSWGSLGPLGARRCGRRAREEEEETSRPSSCTSCDVVTATTVLPITSIAEHSGGVGGGDSRGVSDGSASACQCRNLLGIHSNLCVCQRRFRLFRVSPFYFFFTKREKITFSGKGILRGYRAIQFDVLPDRVPFLDGKIGFVMSNSI